jgi:hypothetical protein
MKEVKQKDTLFAFVGAPGESYKQDFQKGTGKLSSGIWISKTYYKERPDRNGYDFIDILIKPEAGGFQNPLGVLAEVRFGGLTQIRQRVG